MFYLPAHLGVAAIKAETEAITEPTNGTPHTLPAIPSNPGLIGYTPNLPEASARLNNRKGYAVGSAGALYNAPGSPRPQVTVQLRPGSTAFLETYCQRASGELPFFALYVGVGGVFTDVYRFCKVNELQVQMSEPGDGGGGELQVSVTIFALARQSLATPMANDAATLAALGVPLMWHDVREFMVPIRAATEPYAPVETDLRKSLMGLTATLSHNLEYKGCRPDFGDTQPLSRAAYHLLEHHETARAEISLHSRLERRLFTGMVTAQQWGDITVTINDAAVTKAFNMTLENAIVTDETLRGVESSGQISHTVPVELDTITFDDTLPA